MHIYDDFISSLDPYWSLRCTGGGTVNTSASKIRMAFKSAREGKYTDAQIDDYHTTLLRTEFVWKPPLRMTIRARTSHPAATPNDINKNKGTLKGTAGFGFWNKPSLKRGIFTLPEAIWFFYASPPSNMALVPGMPGYGWKAQIVHSMRLGVLPQVIPLSLTS